MLTTTFRMVRDCISSSSHPDPTEEGKKEKKKKKSRNVSQSADLLIVKPMTKPGKRNQGMTFTSTVPLKHPPTPKMNEYVKKHLTKK